MSMNAFYEHHKDNIRFQYRCFDRILLNGLIQPFQQEERVVGFFGTYRELYPVSRDVLREIATQFHNWIANRLIRRGVHFRQSTNAFTSCSDPAVLQEIADSLTAQDLSGCARKWLAQFSPFASPRVSHE